MSGQRVSLAVFVSFAVISWNSAVCAAGPTYTDPKQADADFAFQGEFSGNLKSGEGDQKVGVQVIALGAGKFRAVAYVGGLPGDGWNGEAKHEVDGELKDGAVRFEGESGIGTLQDGVLHVVAKEDAKAGDLKKVDRKSPTLGAAPPEGAVVLFDGSSVDGFEGGKLTEDKLLAAGCTSKQKFGSHTLHIEFQLPYQPEDRGQARGNSGLYLQGRYEVQMLDSFGLEGLQNECGGIYSVKAPDLNMCLPPLSWQTYDVEYTAAKYDDTGKLTANPRVTVRHNGVVIHNNVELPGERNTTAAPVGAGAEPGPIYLQDHGNPVRYRNIWVVAK